MTSSSNITLLVHGIVGVLVIATVATLSGLHVITGDAALGVITGVAGVLLGTSASAVGASSMSSAPPATPTPPSSTPPPPA